MVKIVRTAAATTDLAGIWSYVARDNRTAADKLLEQIDDAFQLLAKTPELGFKLDHIRAGVRCKPVKRNYLIFYLIDGADLVILRVLHGSRKYEDLL